MFTGLIGAGENGARTLNPNGKVALGNNFQLPLYGIVLIAVALLIVVGLLIFLAVKASQKGKRSKVVSESNVWTRESETVNDKTETENTANKDYKKSETKTVVTEERKTVKKKTEEETVVDNNYDDDSSYASREINEEKTQEEKEAYRNREMKQDKVRDEEEDMSFAQAVIVEPEQEEEETVEEEPTPVVEEEEKKEEPEKEEEIKEENKENAQAEETSETVETEVKEETEEETAEENKEEATEENKEEATEENKEEATEETTEEIKEEKEEVEEETEEKRKEETVATVALEKTEEKREPVEKEKISAKPKATVTKAKEESEPKIAGKMEICNSYAGGYSYILRANNGQLLYESKSYKSIDSCKDAIENFKTAVEEGMFTVRDDKFKNYKFILKSPTSNTLIYVGESFSSEASCKSNIESIKRFVKISPIVDMTQQTAAVEYSPYKIPEDLVKSVEKGELSQGKWVIEKVEPTSPTSPFVFLLYANNGQLLYESRDYKSNAGCIGGIKTFVNTVHDGEFIVDPEKSGRFKFVLRSKTVNTVEYYGQSYDTKKSCENNIESVYHFALSSPIPEK